MVGTFTGGRFLRGAKLLHESIIDSAHRRRLGRGYIVSEML
jgi:hypothetical protein